MIGMGASCIREVIRYYSDGRHRLSKTAGAENAATHVMHQAAAHPHAC